jgi:hypothetical protein
MDMWHNGDETERKATHMTVVRYTEVRPRNFGRRPKSRCKDKIRKEFGS